MLAGPGEGAFPSHNHPGARTLKCPEPCVGQGNMLTPTISLSLSSPRPRSLAPPEALVLPHGGDRAGEQAGHQCSRICLPPTEQRGQSSALTQHAHWELGMQGGPLLGGVPRKQRLRRSLGVSCSGRVHSGKGRGKRQGADRAGVQPGSIRTLCRDHAPPGRRQG